jgi:hypothetical protein
VGELVVVEELHGIAQLVRDVTDMVHRIRLVVIVLEEVEDAEAENLEGDTGVAVKVEPIEDFYAQTKTMKGKVSAIEHNFSQKLLTDLLLACPRAFPAR